MHGDGEEVMTEQIEIRDDADEIVLRYDVPFDGSHNAPAASV